MKKKKTKKKKKAIPKHKVKTSTKVLHSLSMQPPMRYLRRPVARTTRQTRRMNPGSPEAGEAGNRRGTGRRKSALPGAALSERGASWSTVAGSPCHRHARAQQWRHHPIEVDVIEDSPWDSLPLEPGSRAVADKEVRASQGSERECWRQAAQEEVQDFFYRLGAVSIATPADLAQVGGRAASFL